MKQNERVWQKVMGIAPTRRLLENVHRRLVCHRSLSIRPPSAFHFLTTLCNATFDSAVSIVSMYTLAVTYRGVPDPHTMRWPRQARRRWLQLHEYDKKSMIRPSLWRPGSWGGGRDREREHEQGRSRSLSGSSARDVIAASPPSSCRLQCSWLHNHSCCVSKNQGFDSVMQ